MDDQRVGRVVRSLRHRRGWRQVDVARAAGCSQNLVSLVERGHLDGLSMRSLRRLLAVLDASAVIEIRWRGAALDRLLDDGHAALGAAVADWLRHAGWIVEVEVTYNEYGDRGSYDLLAFHPVARVLLVVEIKTDLPSAEATLRKVDEKARLAPTVARGRFGWSARSVSRIIVMPESMTLRRRVARHEALFGRALPARNVAVRRWIARPEGQLSGLWFFSVRDSRVGISEFRANQRVRPKNPGSTNRQTVVRERTAG